ncbi:MAG: phage holin [Lachnospiraceae bacterium]|nr:phage holin [Lachnospiraceae bacterium]
MNIKLRLKNKTTLLAIVLAAVAFVYQILGIVGVAVPIAEDQVVQIAGIIINLLVGLGILVDPTTAGIGDSARAKKYEEPLRVTIPDAAFPAGGEHMTAQEHEANDPPDPEV